MKKLFALFFLMAVSAIAQEVTLRFYIVPMEQVGNQRAPKYFGGPRIPGIPELDGVAMSCQDFGLEKIFVVGSNLTTAQHTALMANVDVLAIPTNLDANVSAVALNTIQTALENLKIPGTWITTENTYRQVVKFALAVAFLNQQMHALINTSLFESSANLDTRMNQIPVATRNALSQGAQRLGLDVDAIKGTTTIRQALLLLAEQMPETTLNGERF